MIALLIIGGGPTGFAAARAYRECGGEGEVAIVAEEQRMPYRRPPLTKELLRGEIEEAELPLESECWLHANRVRLAPSRAVHLNAGERTVSLVDGRTLEYETCLLAAGAEPVRLPVPGADDPAVRVLRTLDQLRELNARLQTGAPVTVIGSGFIGCEIAASLRRRGHPVTMVSNERAPNIARLGEDAAERIGGWLRDEGVTLHLGHEVDAITRGSDGALTVTTDAERVTARLVVMAAGVTPRAELARDAELELDGGAIPVTAAMRTRVPGLLAAGDVCIAENARAGRPLRVEHWGEALAHGEVAGRTAAGTQAAWDAVPGFWSTIGNRTLKHAAWGDGFDEARCRPHPQGGFTVSYSREGRLVGVLTHQADEDYERGRDAVARAA